METDDLKLCNVSLMMFFKYRLNNTGERKQPQRKPTEKRKEIITNLQVKEGEKERLRCE